MAYNQQLSRNDTSSIRKYFKVLKEKKIFVISSLNTFKVSETTRVINQVSFDGMANSSIVAKIW